MDELVIITDESHESEGQKAMIDVVNLNEVSVKKEDQSNGEDFFIEV